MHNLNGPMNKLLISAGIIFASNSLICAQATPPNQNTRPDAAARNAQRAQRSDEEKNLYTKIEYRIRMRDGVHLACEVYVPKDADGHSPILMQRTPYGSGPYGPD